MTAQSPSLQDPRRWYALALLAVAQFVVVLDGSIMNIALPSIGTALDVPTENLSWIINAYLLTFGGFLLLGGRIADLLGRRRVFVSGLLLFAIASLAGALSQSEAQLIAARAVQGLGAALLAPAALSILTTIFSDGAERNKALAVWGAVAGSGAAAGVLLGGVLTSALGWEWVLLINVPIGIAAVLATPRLIDESRAHGERRSFDVPGAVAVTAGLSAAVYALVEADAAGWGSLRTVGMLSVSAALLAAFVVIELRSKAPLVPFSVFRKRTLTGANVTMFAVGGAMFGLFFFLSIYMQQVLEYSAIEAGLTQLPLAGALVIAAGAASPLVTKLGFRAPLIAGLGLFAAGLAWFSRISADGSFLGDILGPSLLVGVGLGMAFVALTGASVHGVRERESGLASGLINTTQQIGGALGLAVLATIANSRTDSVMNAATGTPDVKVALTEGFQSALLASAGIAVVAILAAVLLVRETPSRTEESDYEPEAELEAVVA